MKRLPARTTVKVPAAMLIPIVLRAASWWKTAVHFAWDRKTRSTRFSMWSVTSKLGRSYHWPSCMLPASMRWLLHSRRDKREQPVLDTSGLPQPAASLPPSAGVGDKESPVWMCKSCINHLCAQHLKMPPLALANSMFLGRHHRLFGEATFATKMLASPARLLMRQLFLGRG